MAAFTVCLALLCAPASPAVLAAANAEESSTSIFAAYSTAHEVTVTGATQRILYKERDAYLHYRPSGGIKASLSSIARANTFV
jgi:hypothetical protein